MPSTPKKKKKTKELNLGDEQTSKKSKSSASQKSQRPKKDRSRSQSKTKKVDDSPSAVKSPKTPKSAGYNSKKKKVKPFGSINGTSESGVVRSSWWSLALDEDELLAQREWEMEEIQQKRKKLLAAKYELEKDMSIAKGLVAERLKQAKAMAAISTTTIRTSKPIELEKRRAEPLKTEAYSAFSAPSYPKTAAQKTLVKETAKKHFLLKDLVKGATKIDMKKLVRAFEPIEIEPGQSIVSKGDKGQHLYIVQEGSVQIQSQTSDSKQTAHAGSVFGTQNLLFQPYESNTIVAGESVLEDDRSHSSVDILRDNVREDASTDKAFDDGVSLVSASSVSNTKLLRLHQADYRGLCQTTERAKERRQAIAQNESERDAMVPPTDDSPVDQWYEDHQLTQVTKDIQQALEAHSKSSNDWDKLKVLGEGQFGEVWLVKPKSHIAELVLQTSPATPDSTVDQGREFALKIQTLDPDNAAAEDMIQNEISIMKEIVGYEGVSTLYRTYDTEEDAGRTVDMILGLIPGGELWDLIHQEDEETGEWLSGIPEAHAQFYSLVVADTLGYLHDRCGILFRDLKPENIMIGNDGYPVIVDFGFAIHCPNNEMTYTFCGTPNYVAPETITNGGQTKAVDYWALGVVIYEMISGENPFYYDGLEEMALLEAICDDPPEPLDRNKFSEDVRDLIHHLLLKDPAERLGTQNKHHKKKAMQKKKVTRFGREEKGSVLDILHHSWFKHWDLNQLRAKQVRPPWIPGDLSEDPEKIEIDPETKAGFLSLASENLNLQLDLGRTTRNGSIEAENEDDDYIATKKFQDEANFQDMEALETSRIEEERQKEAEAARLKAQEEAALEAARIEEERQKKAEAQAEAARLKAQEEAALEAARIEEERQKEAEAARLKAQEEAALEAARIEEQRQRGARMKALEAARIEEEQQKEAEAARLEAQKEAALEAARLEEEQQREAEASASLSKNEFDDCDHEEGELSLDEVFDDESNSGLRMRDKSFDESWGKVASGSQTRKLEKRGGTENSPVPKGLVRRLVNGQKVQWEKSPESLTSPRKVQEELNSSVKKGMVAERLSSANKRSSGVPSLFSPFEF